MVRDGKCWNPRWKLWMNAKKPKHILPMQEIASRYLAGETCRQLAESYRNALVGSSKPEEVVRRRLLRAGVTRRPRGWQNQRRTKNHQWKGGYKVPMHYYRRQAYEVAAICDGKPLQPGEVIHHVDENNENPAPENLMVFPNQGAHARYHQQLLKSRWKGQPADAIQLALENGARQLQRPVSLTGWIPYTSPRVTLGNRGRKIGRPLGVRATQQSVHQQ